MLKNNPHATELPRTLTGKGTAEAFLRLDADGRQQLADSVSEEVPCGEVAEIPYSSGDRLYPEGYYL